MADARIELPWRPTRKQWELLSYQATPTPTGRPPVSVIAALGAYASGKTYAGAMAHLTFLLRNGWHAGWGSDRPLAAALAPTSNGVRQSLLRVYKALTPPELIVRRWESPFPRWILANGVELQFLSGDSAAIEGQSWISAHLDEISQPQFADPARWTNLLARLRGPQAREFLMVVSGLPEQGFVRDTFDLSDRGTTNRLTLLFGMRDNPHASPEMIDQVLSDNPSGYERALVEGGWLPSQSALYSMFDSKVNVVGPDKVNMGGTASVGIDVGLKHGAYVLAQLIHLPDGTRGCLVLDDCHLVGATTGELAMAARSSPYGHLIRGDATIAVDPNTPPDAFQAIRHAFPQQPILRREPADPYYRTITGIKLVQTSLRNAKGESRLFFLEHLKGRRNGVIDAMLGTKVTKGGSRDKGDYDEQHCEDALRLVVTHLLGPQAGALRVMSRR